MPSGVEGLAWEAEGCATITARTKIAIVALLLILMDAQFASHSGVSSYALKANKSKNAKALQTKSSANTKRARSSKVIRYSTAEWVGEN